MSIRPCILSSLFLLNFFILVAHEVAAQEDDDTQMLVSETEIEKAESLSGIADNTGDYLVVVQLMAINYFDNSQKTLLISST